MKYDFDQIINREGYSTVKYDLREVIFNEKDIIPLWVADMDFATAPEIVDALQKRVSHPIYGYTLQNDDFWNAIINWTYKRHQWKVIKNELVFVPGIVPALGMLVQALTNVNDKVALFSPVYPPFYENIEKNKRELVNIPLINNDNYYSIDFGTFEDELKKGCKLLMFCNPHNPSGRVWKKEELEKLLDLCDQYDCNIISDEIHADLTLFGNKHVPFASLSAIAEKRVITCMAPSKTFNLAGLNCAYLIFKNPKLKSLYLDEVKHMHLDFGGTMGTEALKAAYNLGEDWYQELLKYIEENIKYVQEELKDTPIKIMPIEATYLLWLDCRGINESASMIVNFFHQKAKVGVQDGRHFGYTGAGFMRLNTACPRPVLEEAIKRIKGNLE
ncbi:PatB family C-S lyase [Flammeovirga sp. SubArs3]|uniref:MalY/PatB family protein n=1 Tax=Flammeovirga sp. SubArs3 TaxID=2995316 RepID=UPI00248B3A69|nr:PatB family C-S lyase [Flammeovirga sp. SubArs3]